MADRVGGADELAEGGIPLKLGWSNPDCGPESMRLYALDQGEQPRWAEPHARTAETVLREAGAHEGSRWLLVPASQAAELDRLSAVEKAARALAGDWLEFASVEAPLLDDLAAVLRPVTEEFSDA